MQRLCARYGVSRAGYYAWVHRAPAAHAEQDRWLVEKILVVHAASEGTYGSPRICQSLRAAGIPVGQKRIARLMRAHGIRARAAKLYHPNPGTHAFFLGIPNRAQNHLPTAPDQVWVGDITYLRLGEGWLYLAVVMDRYSRRLVGWSFGLHKDAALTRRALDHAVARRHPPAGLIFHTDRGIEYAAYEFRTRLAALGIVQSMNRRGRPTDNAHMESFFHSMKSDVIHGRRFEHRVELEGVVRRYIAFYNRRRLHSSLDYRSPLAYERDAA